MDRAAPARTIGAFLVAFIGTTAIRVLPSTEPAAWLALAVVGLAAGAVAGRPAGTWSVLAGWAIAEIGLDLAAGGPEGPFWYLVIAGRVIVLFVVAVAGTTLARPPSRLDRRWRITTVAVAGASLLAIVAYGGYALARSGEYLDQAGEGDCRTPGVVAYGWPYEAINYDKADDAVLLARHPDPRQCFDGNPKDKLPDQGARAGTEVVSADGIRVAGWYIPAADGSSPTGATLVLVHGGGDNKSGMLKYAVPLHATYNLVLIDLRNQGRSTGRQSSGGLREALDLRAMIDWLERTKQPSWLGIVGNSNGAATALVEAMDDPRPRALVLDSMHANVVTQLGNVFETEQHIFETAQHVPAWPAAWAFVTGASLRLGADITAADPVRTIGRIGSRPILLTHGLRDQVDRPADALEPNVRAALAAGIDLEVHVCPTAGHGRVVVEVGQLPPEGERACTSDWGTWVRDFLARARGLAAS